MGRVNRRIGKSSETAVSTADGTGGGVLNAFLQEYFNRSGNIVNVPGAYVPPPLEATGGIIREYTDSGTVYRAHIFNSSGSFTVSASTGTVDYLVVGGGGGGGDDNAGGGGAGGLRSTVTNTGGGGSLESKLPVSPGSYSVVVGSGGDGADSSSSRGSNGSPSTFGSIVSQGGGGGGSDASDPVRPGSPGGSGGGGGSKNASPYSWPGGDGNKC